MSLDGTYDLDNIFARIVRGDMPAARVFEDQDTLAIMDLFPQARGHTLVVHKSAPARNLLDIGAAPLQALILTVQRVTRAVGAALQPAGILVTQFNGAAAGQTIFHLHFHIIPRWPDAPLALHAGSAMADASDLTDLAARIAAKIE